MNTDTPDLTTRDLLDIVAAYMETAFRALDRGETGIARAALRRMSQYLLDLNEDTP